MPETSVTVSGNKEHRRMDWLSNHLAIEQSILRTIQEEGRFPTYREMECETGLSQKTIAEHSKTLNMADIRQRSRLLGPQILEKQAIRALNTGDHNEAKTYFKLNYDWAERQELSANVQHEWKNKRLSDLSDAEFANVEPLLLDGKAVLRDGVIVEAEFEEQNGQMDSHLSPIKTPGEFGEGHNEQG